METSFIEATGMDCIGDVHGCLGELEDLLTTLGYDLETLTHPDKRLLVFVGDLTDRGPDSVGVLRLALRAMATDYCRITLGNHCDKLRRFLKGNKVQPTHGLDETIRQISEECDLEEIARFRDMLESLPYYLRLQVPGEPEVVVCHAGMPRDMVGRMSKAVKAHCLYGEVTGKVCENNYPIRGTSWEASWPKGDTQDILVHGHTPTKTPFPNPKQNIICVDQGAVFGGALTAYRFPERQFEMVGAFDTYVERPEYKWGR